MPIDAPKRRFLQLAALGAVSPLALNACSQKNESAAASNAAAPNPAVNKDGPLKAAWLYVGPLGNAGWEYQHDLGRQAVQVEFGERVQTRYVANVAEGADTERVIRDLIHQGHTMIVGASFGYMEPMIKMAAEFPDVRFEHGTGGYKTAPNLNVYDSRFYQPVYLAGIAAAGMSKTNVLGFVGSVPVPEVLRNINAFMLGARTIKPQIKIRVVFVNGWFAPPKETEAANSLLNGGADVLLQNTNSTAVLKAAEQAGKYAFGWDSDMSPFGGKAHLGSVVVDWAPYYKKMVGEALEGRWKGGQSTRWGMPQDQNLLVTLSDQIPPELKEQMLKAQASIKDGSFDVFTGPIVDRDGKERLAVGVRADDDWMGAINFFVPGIEGQIPSPT